MDKLENYIYSKFKEKILFWDDKIVCSIYAISFFVYDIDDDPRTPSVTLGYNTHRQWNKAINEGASDKLEAKWNYAFWLQNEQIIIGEDKESLKMIKNWVNELGCKNINDKAALNNYKIYDSLVGCITKEFVNVLVNIAKKLFENDIIKKKFEKNIPIFRFRENKKMEI